MSIEDEIAHRVANGLLHNVRPTSGAWVREIVVTPELNQELERYGEDERIGQLRAFLDVYLNNRRIVVGEGKSKLGDLKKLEGFHEVWEFRSLSPRPSLRIFGRFAAKNLFIGTRLRPRILLGEYDSIFWRFEAKKCASRWRQLFQSYEPLERDTIHDYLTNAVRESDLRSATPSGR